MRRILLIKTSSLGDVVHNLPVASDIARTYGDAGIDWVVEESFAAIPRLHPGVGEIIPAAVRRWRSSLFSTATWREILRFISGLREHHYDAVIDTQGLLKSALITCAAHGKRYGLDWRSSREPLRCFYDRTFRVPWTQHAVERNRSLAAQALGYTLEPRIDYAIGAIQQQFTWLTAQPYAVLLHATSAESKQWPDAQWENVCKYLILNNIFCTFPWGNEAERARSEYLHTRVPDSVVPPRLPLDQVASLLAGAYLVIGVDTGLTHLAAALGRPSIGIYCATDPAATGLYGAANAVNLGGINAPPTAAEVIAAIERVVS